jgi:hypothetical protein
MDKKGLEIKAKSQRIDSAGRRYIFFIFRIFGFLNILCILEKIFFYFWKVDGLPRSADTLVVVTESP